MRRPTTSSSAQAGGYQREFLLKFAELPRSQLERLESLEQLRALSAGYSILVEIVNEPTIGIGTREDYRAFVRRAARC